MRRGYCIRRRVIDLDELKADLIKTGAQHQSSYPSKSVDTYLHCHCCSLLQAVQYAQGFCIRSRLFYLLKAVLN
jgi:hypothetical protein